MTDAATGFEMLVEAVAATGAMIRGQRANQSGADEQGDGYAYGTELIRLALDLYADADGMEPCFVPFSSPTPYHAGQLAVSRIQGGVNPDGLYDFAVLDPENSYRIEGRRGNDCYFSLSFSGGRDGEWPERTAATLNDRQMTFAADGSFEVTVSSQPPGAGGQENWVRMEPDICSVIVRQYFLLPPSERRPGTLSIEVIDPPVTRSAPGTEAVGRRLTAAAAFIRSTNTHFPMAAGPPPNSFSEPFGYSGESGALGTTDNVYCMGRWRLAPGQRLVVDTTPIACGYWSLQAWNRWGQSLAHSFDDSTYNRQIANRANTRRNSDGSVTIVACETDPGGGNWLDTNGWTEGTLIFRYLYPEAKPERPSCVVQ